MQGASAVKFRGGSGRVGFISIEDGYIPLPPGGIECMAASARPVVWHW